MAEVYPNCNNHNNHSPKPEDSCKIFVGGLSWDTTQEKLNTYFSQFGEVIDCILMMDTATKRSRGFGFVTYKDPSSVLRVLENGPHILDNKSIDPKAAVPRFPCANITKPSTHPSSPINSRRCNKIFVGGIGQANEEDLRGYFQTYGIVSDVTIMMDKNTGRPRGTYFYSYQALPLLVLKVLNHPNIQLKSDTIP
uniref:RNA-binding protein Musashi homolog 1 (Trinotate prediction) n=1 Tax=Henneguya salminicola TaxID=69463 RepID=A0A6G3MFR7_HENSL